MNDQQRREYRQFIRSHHPDVGGDPEQFAAGLARLRAAAVVEPVGTFTARWPDWVAPDDRRLRADIVFRRKPHGVAAVLATLRRLAGRDQRPSRVR